MTVLKQLLITTLRSKSLIVNAIGRLYLSLRYVDNTTRWIS